MKQTRKNNLTDAIALARGMVAANRTEANDPDNDDELRYGAAQAAFAQECVLDLFTGQSTAGR
ncbi:hypothetical protein [Candidatus Frankia alpina]|uniref:Uncharacterized protein n=1 Tax=Candidatus Frankia alpina TaxID=2699483 RepID=A0A4S5EL26_9ACTN|nr:hypothetical protein [Candidatus Frankia alpina]THJ72643.1 hypothetical protein E7Y31_14255 [Candidatus Frankia alpina]